MRLAKLALIAAATLIAGQALAQEVPARIRQAGRIVIATMPNYPPITYKDPANNQLMGLDIDLGNAIGRELNLRVEWQEIAFAQMLPSLQTGRVDTVLAGMSDLPARREFVDYMVSGAQFFTLTALNGQIRTAQDLCGRPVGASRSTSWPGQIEQWSRQNCVAQGRQPIQVVGTEGSVDARTQLRTRRLEGAVQGSETLPWIQTQEPNTYVILGEPFTRSLAGMPFAKTDEGRALRAAVRAALTRLHASGEYDRILERHGLRGNRLEAIVENQGQ
jgi:polar amino acid transport system substrate-binding protein